MGFHTPEVSAFFSLTGGRFDWDDLHMSNEGLGRKSLQKRLGVAPTKLQINAFQNT